MGKQSLYQPSYQQSDQASDQSLAFRGERTDESISNLEDMEEQRDMSMQLGSEFGDPQVDSYVMPGFTDNHLGQQEEDLSMMMVDTPSPPPPPLLNEVDDKIRSKPQSADRFSPHPVPASTEFPECGKGLEIEEEGEYLWEISNWTLLSTEKVYSPEFLIAGHKWKTLIWPNGNSPYEGRAVSAYVAISDAEEKTAVDAYWGVCAQFVISFVNPSNSSAVINKHAQHRFDAFEPDWGFGLFCSQKALLYGEANQSALLHDDQLKVMVKVRVIKDPTGVLWHNFINYDSKRITGLVGLQNQGATCYMNSLLQSLFHTSVLRKATFQISTESDSPTSSVPLSLQRLFYNLQFSDSPPGTIELTKSFGWDTMESFMQHDIHEFCRELMESLETKMKKSIVEGTIERLFVGKLRNVIKCTNVDYESVREETFYDLQLTIRRVKNLEESFEKYIEAELMEGDNKYRAEEYGLQDARKYVEFVEFPPVLHLHLVRYAFDPMTGNTIKINDRFEYPEEIALGKFLKADGSGVSDKPVKEQVYVLQSVLVHSGESHGGHYFVFIRDPLRSPSRWLKFDDQKVIPVSAKEAIEDNFGGEEDPGRVSGTGEGYRGSARRFKRFTNAYMLVYIRKADLEDVLVEVNESDIPGYLPRKIKEDQVAEEARLLERQRQFNSISVTVLTDRAIKAHHGSDLFNLSTKHGPLTPVVNLRMSRDDSLEKLEQYIAEEEGLIGKPYSIRLWTMAARQNRTMRIDDPVIAEDGKPLSALMLRGTQSSIVIYAEIAMGTEFTARAETHFEPFAENMCLIYCKYFDVDKLTLTPVGPMIVQNADLPKTIRPILARMAGLPEDTLLDIFEEVKPSRIEPVDCDQSFAKNALQHGDIIVFQRSEDTGDMLDPGKIPVRKETQKVTEYYERLLKTIMVRFKPLKNAGIELNTLDGKSEEFTLPLLSSMHYSEIVALAATHLSCFPKNLLLMTVDSISEAPLAPLRRASDPKLSEMIGGAMPNALYYEKLDMTLEEFESLKTIKFRIRGIKGEDDENENEAEHEHDTVIYKVQLPMEAAVGDIISKLPAAIQEALRNKEVRLLEVKRHQIVSVYSSDTMIASIELSAGPSTSYILEPVPEDQCASSMITTPGDRLVNVFHYSRDPWHSHSAPFIFKLHAGEQFSKTRQRLVAATLSTMSEKDWEKCRISTVTFGRATLIGNGQMASLSTNTNNMGFEDILPESERQEEEVLADRLWGGEDQLGLDHPDKRLTPAVHERGLKIRN